MAEKSKASIERVVQTAIDSALKDIHTCLPAVVTKVDHTTQLIEAQIVIKRKLSEELVNLPVLVDVPLRYPRSKTFSITFPIEIGDHVLIIFAERSIDTWLKEGGIQDPFDVRKFHLSDAFAIPSMYPQTDVIPDFNSSDLELKTNSGNTKIKVKAEGVDVNTSTEVNITAPQSNINGNVKINGNLDVTGIITAPTIEAITTTGSLKVRGKEVYNHNHTQPNDSGGNIEAPTNGMT